MCKLTAGTDHQRQSAVTIFALARSDYPADARADNTFNEDIESFLKTARSDHGGWFMEDRRMAGGACRGDLAKYSGITAADSAFELLHDLLAAICPHDGAPMRSTNGTYHC